MASVLLSSIALALLLQVGELVSHVEQTKLVKDGRIVQRVERRGENVLLVRFDDLKFTKDDLDCLADITYLRGLSFRKTNFNDSDVSHLQRIKELRYLDLSSTNVTDKAIDQLVKLKDLRTLCLADVNITPKGIERLRTQFKPKRGERRLFIGYSPRDKPKDFDDASLLCCRSIDDVRQVKDAVANTAGDMKPYDELIEQTDVKIRMVPIPGGEFSMGSPKSELRREEDEGPQRNVTIAPFWMAETETTWNTFLTWTDDLDIPNRDYFGMVDTDRDRKADEYQLSQPTMTYVVMDHGMGYDGYPAMRMTQLAARTFCKWLSEKTGRYYRLPTEAEWEYACRAGTTTAYSWGDDPSKASEYAWHYENAPREMYEKVRGKKPNPWGLYDMHGNVSEWVLDQYAAKFFGTDGANTNPLNIPKTIYPRVVRGGSYLDDLDILRSAARDKSSKKYKQQDPVIPPSIWWHTDATWVGFRIVRPLTEPTEKEKADKWDKQAPEQREAWLKRKYPNRKRPSFD